MPYRFGQEGNSRGRRYRLPSMPQRAAIPASPRRPEAPLPSSVRGTPSGEIAALDRLREQRRERVPRAAQTFNVHSPVPRREGARMMRLKVSDDSWLPAPLGRIRLLHGVDAVNLERVELGQLSLHLHHDVTQVAGRILSAGVSGATLYADTELSRSLDPKTEQLIDEGALSGISPGFLLDRVRALKAGEQGFDKDSIDLVVERWTVYEVSLTSVPRNPNARIIGRFSMTTPQTALGAPELATTDDLDQLSLVTARLALSTGEGSAKQRERAIQVLRQVRRADRGGNTPR